MRSSANSTGDSGRARAYRYLRDYVLTNPEVGGTFLNELDIGREVGVSRTPVREALLLLVADGLVQMVPKRGAYVPPLSSAETTDLFELRSLLEVHAARVLIKHGSAPIATIRAMIEKQEGLIGVAETTAQTLSAFIEIDRQFHQAIIDAAGNELISHTYEGLRNRQMRIGIAALLNTADRQRSVCVEHRRIMEALELGKEDRAVKAIQSHLETTLRQVQHR